MHYENWLGRKVWLDYGNGEKFLGILTEIRYCWNNGTPGHYVFLDGVGRPLSYLYLAK